MYAIGRVKNTLPKLPSDQTNKEQKQQSSYHWCNDDAYQFVAEGNVQHRAEQPAADKSAKNAYNNVTQQAETITLTDLTSKPTRDCTDKEREN